MSASPGLDNSEIKPWNIYQFWCNRFKGCFSKCKDVKTQETVATKVFKRRLLNALRILKTVGVVHANITPQTVTLVNQKDRPFRVGPAIKAAFIMQPAGNRSPDVILGLPISEEVDMWSLACVLETMYLSGVPFPQRCSSYLAAEEDKVVTGLLYQINAGSSTKFDCLDDLGKMQWYPEKGKHIHKRVFVSLLKMMLQPNFQKRTTRSNALDHSFSTLSDLDDDTSSQ
ncbi:hypothetical protein Q5P01_021146 [Channa striata]|uniref:Protein kinase domain-containing protein n=1 Tax=Channa striata TaxID=64152 RepID=A0AA88RYA2_CHASR|nr:hypothetical protein Q5P01_021146 [Channa striata]